MDYVPMPEFFDDFDTMKVSNPMVNQFWSEYKDNISINYAFTYDGYSFKKNMELNCHNGGQYCFCVSSKFYTYRGYDEHDYRFSLAGFTPFYSEYKTESAEKIIFNADKKARPKIWKKTAKEYRQNAGIRITTSSQKQQQERK